MKTYKLAKLEKENTKLKKQNELEIKRKKELIKNNLYLLENLEKLKKENKKLEKELDEVKSIYLRDMGWLGSEEDGKEEINKQLRFKI